MLWRDLDLCCAVLAKEKLMETGGSKTDLREVQEESEARRAVRGSLDAKPSGWYKELIGYAEIFT